MTRKIVFTFSFLFIVSAVWSQQVEELPEDASQTVHPYPSDACEARGNALTAVQPKLERPRHTREHYEDIKRTQEPQARGLQYDQATYDAMSAARIRRLESIEKSKEKIKRLAEDLADAKTAYTDKTLIADLEAKLNKARKELKTIQQEDLAAVEPYLQMQAALQVLEANRALTLLVLWDDHDRILKRFSKADEAMEKELDSVKAAFEAEKTRFSREWNALKQQSDRSETTLQKSRDLKLESAKVFTQLKNRLQEFICWPEVQTFDKQLQDVIANLKTSKTSLAFGSDFEVEELPEDRDPFTIAGDGGPVDPSPGAGDQNAGSKKTFTGKWNSSFGTLTLSQGGTAVSGSSDYYGTQINGTIKEDGKLHFSWSDSNNKKGIGVFELSSNGQTFSGSWNYLLSDGKTLGNGGLWSGRRIQ